jgi:hypothetical protein
MNIHIIGSISSSNDAYLEAAGRRDEATGEENGKMQGTARRRKWGRCKATGEESVDAEYFEDPPGISRANAKSAASTKGKHYAGEEQS